MKQPHSRPLSEYTAVIFSGLVILAFLRVWFAA
ncbi:hypothetical protein J3D56_003412 [Erwinia persicina]|jgi:hypothetical protein|nr:hypothetical protein [Erwinia persicina]